MFGKTLAAAAGLSGTALMIYKMQTKDKFTRVPKINHGSCLKSIDVLGETAWEDLDKNKLTATEIFRKEDILYNLAREGDERATLANSYQELYPDLVSTHARMAVKSAIDHFGSPVVIDSTQYGIANIEEATETLKSCKKIEPNNREQINENIKKGEKLSALLKKFNNSYMTCLKQGTDSPSGMTGEEMISPSNGMHRQQK